MDIVLCSITREKNPNDTILGKSIEKIGDVSSWIQTENVGDNAKGLSQYYNDCLEKFRDSDIIVFCHDDVDLIFSDLSYQAAAALKHFDVAGVAGCISPKIIDKNLWHWMAGDIKNCRGIAGHAANKDQFYVTSFGVTPARVTILDGVFLVLNVKSIINKGIKFDEQFMFHHYDIDFSLTCNKHALKLGVWPFLINHQSPGLKNFNEAWNTSNQKFINKWKKI